MKQKIKTVLRNVLITAGILLISFACSLVMQNLLDTQTLIPSVFLLGVFLTSLLTQGYMYGIVSALLSMLAVNFAFTFPYFEFNFTIHENAVSALLMIVVTVVTGALTTKLKKQEMLRAETEKEKMRANLLRAISHDLRTPLTTIYGASATMIENYDILEDENKIQLLRGIQEDSQWLIRMVENLLSITKVDTNHVKLNKNSIVLEELLDSTLEKFKKRYPDQQVVLSLPDEFITLSMDAILIEQVLVNLLENAVHHAEGMTRLELRVTSKDEKIHFEVIDDGCGMDNDRIKALLAGRLLPADGSADSSKQFMGIGLSVCATIVKAHGGDIWAANNPAGGMRFGFSMEKEVLENEQ